MRQRFLLVLAMTLAPPAFAGFPATDVFLPAVGRLAGSGGSQFYTTVWVSNASASQTPVHFTFQFLKGNQANPAPPSFTDTIDPGHTRVYENVVQEKLGLTGVLGAARITADGEILASERIYNQFSGDTIEKSVGLFFAAVPATFAIGLGGKASIQGVSEGLDGNFRYNFALVETAGAPATVHVSVFNEDGSIHGSRDFPILPYEQIQPNVQDVSSDFTGTNGRIEATVTSGAGRVILAGAQLANGSQDSSGFEMSFNRTLLAGSGGGGGGLTLPFSGTFNLPDDAAFEVTNPGSDGTAVAGFASHGQGIFGGTEVAVGVSGYSSGNGTGVLGSSNAGAGVKGVSSAQEGVLGQTSNSTFSAVHGKNTAAAGAYAPGVLGESSSTGGIGVWGIARATSGQTYGVAAETDSPNGIGVQAFVNGSGGTGTAYLAFLGTASTASMFKGVVNGIPVVRIDKTGKGFFNGGTAMGGADLAEIIASGDRLLAGDVVEIDPAASGRFRRSQEPESAAVAGVISTDPGVTMNMRSAAAEEDPGPRLALVGRVPVHVTDENGTIHPGDLLVSSSTPGHAMKAPENSRAGTVIGKALECHPAGTGTIEMLVMLR